MNESPKTRLRRNEKARQVHIKFIQDPDFEPLMETAMLQFIHEMPWSCADLGTASANQFRLEGARRFRDIFMRLSEPDSPKPPQTTDNLMYQ